MKRTLFYECLFLLTSFFFMSCKDDPAPSVSVETVLSKVFVDGQLEREYKYNSGKQLEQMLQYKTTTGQLTSYVEFEYDTRGFLQNETAYNSDGKPTGRTQYLKDADGRFISSEYRPLVGTDSGKVTSRKTFEYNEKGLISKQAWNDPDTQEEESYQVYFYFPNGNLERYEYFWTVAPVPEKAVEASYSPAGQPLPESLSRLMASPINLSLYNFVAEKIEYEIFDTALASAAEYHELITDRVYDNDGFVTEQTITSKYIAPASPDDVIKMTYEYKKI